MTTHILFVCIGNACRSQMAEGWLKFLAAKTDIAVHSAGSSPLGHIPEETVAVMAEVGIDISEQWSKSIAELPRQDFDYVISLCGDRCPYVPAEQHVDWTIPDPIGQPIEAYREARDLLRKHIEAFLEKIE